MSTPGQYYKLTTVGSGPPMFNIWRVRVQSSMQCIRFALLFQTHWPFGPMVSWHSIVWCMWMYMCRTQIKDHHLPIHHGQLVEFNLQFVWVGCSIPFWVAETHATKMVYLSLCNNFIHSFIHLLWIVSFGHIRAVIDSIRCHLLLSPPPPPLSLCFYDQTRQEEFKQWKE